MSKTLRPPTSCAHSISTSGSFRLPVYCDISLPKYGNNAQFHPGNMMQHWCRPSTSSCSLVTVYRLRIKLNIVSRAKKKAFDTDLRKQFPRTICSGSAFCLRVPSNLIAYIRNIKLDGKSTDWLWRIRYDYINAKNYYRSCQLAKADKWSKMYLVRS